jgi:dUTP pyrophosphatase
MDIIDIFSDMKTVQGKNSDGNIDKLLIVRYKRYGYILVAPKRQDIDTKENNEIDINFTDSQRHSLAEYMLQCTLRKDIKLDELNGFEKADWDNEAIEAIDYLNDIIDWMGSCGIIKTSSETSLKVAKLYDNAYVPEYEHSGDAGFSLRVRNAFRIRAGEQKLIKLGVSFIIDDNYEVQIRSRSGRTFKQKLVVAQGTGTIDSGYRGEIGVILYNRSDRTISIDKGESIAQGVLCKLPNTEIVEIDKNELTTSERGNRGYGSTGL